MGRITVIARWFNKIASFVKLKQTAQKSNIFTESCASLRAGGSKAVLALNRKKGLYDQSDLEEFFATFESIQKDNSKNPVVLHPHLLLGKIVHYYHFFYGFLAPMIEILEMGALTSDDFLFYPDAAIMNRHIRDVLAHYGIKGAPYPMGMGKTIADVANFRQLHIPGHDDSRDVGNLFEPRQFEVLRGFRDDFLVSSPAPKKLAKVIFIDRDDSVSYYKSDEYIRRYNIKGQGNSGADRRSIANSRDIRDRLDAEFSANTVFLETQSLKSTMETFHGADIIVAQHGAGIANIAWCELPAILIEIVPSSKLGTGSRFFKNLSRHAGLEYIPLVQSKYNSEIDIDQLTAYIRYALKRIDALGNKSSG